MNTTDHGRKIEFVCERCLHAVYALDTDPTPRCPRGHGRLTPDSDEPRPKAPVATAARRSLAGL